MTSFIENVAMGNSSIGVRLSTTGVYSCIVIIIHLNDNTTFMYHMDPIDFDIEELQVQKEIQKFIVKTISKFNKHKKSDLFFEKVYLFGGLDNPNYVRFNTELNEMKKIYSTLIPLIEKLNVDDLRNFVKMIEYSNVSMNIDGEDNRDEVNSSTFISDLTIICDWTTVPPTFCMAQYYGTEAELCGGIRQIQPHLMFIFNFALHSWDVIDRRQLNIQLNHIDKILKEFNSNSTLIDNLEKTENQIMNYIAYIKH